MNIRIHTSFGTEKVELPDNTPIVGVIEKTKQLFPFMKNWKMQVWKTVSEPFKGNELLCDIASEGDKLVVAQSGDKIFHNSLS